MTFGQTWTTDGTTAGSSSAAPLDFNNFSFDPSLIESIPENIPDFFLAFDNAFAAHAHQQQQQQQDPNLLSALPPQHQQPSGNLSSLASSSPSEGVSPHNFTTHTPQPQPAESSNLNPSSSSSQHQQHVSGAGRGSLVLLSPSPRNNNTTPSSQAQGEDPDIVIKRQRNTIAARKYRQKRLDRIKELEDALEAMTKERDDYRLKLARQEAETAALKEMMQMGKKGGGKDAE